MRCLIFIVELAYYSRYKHALRAHSYIRYAHSPACGSHAVGSLNCTGKLHSINGQIRSARSAYVVRPGMCLTGGTEWSTRLLIQRARSSSPVNGLWCFWIPCVIGGRLIHRWLLWNPLFQSPAFVLSTAESSR